MPSAVPRELNDWLRIEVLIEVEEGPANRNRNVEFTLSFINESGKDGVLPEVIQSWKNSHPCHLLFRDQNRELIEPASTDDIEMAPVSLAAKKGPVVPPGDLVQTSFTGVLKRKQKLELPGWTYDFGGIDRVSCQYQYAGRYSMPSLFSFVS